MGSRILQSKNSCELSGQVKVEKWNKNIYQVFSKRLQSSPRILEKRMYSSRDDKYIFIENVYFRMNLKAWQTTKFATNAVDISILMPNESLGDMCLYNIWQKILYRTRKWHLPKQKNKVAANKEKHLHNNKLMRTADVMIGF